MNNGQNTQPQQDLSLVGVTGSSVVNFEQYHRNREQFARARDTLNRIEQENELAHARWLQTVQDLSRRVEEGRQAE